MAGEPENQRIARLTPLDDVLASIAASVKPVVPRKVDLAAAFNRALAQDVAIATAQPAEPRALRDGYAVRAEDIADAGPYAPVPLAAPKRVDVGEALPPDTDAVVPLDAVTTRGAIVQAVAPAAAGDGVLPNEGDVRAGDVIARKGWRLNNFNLAMLALGGCRDVTVREPRIRLVKARADADPVLDAIVDLLARALDARGCAVRRSAGDLPAALADSGSDAVIGIGGTGNGRSDTSVQALAGVANAVTHGIAISPGETAAFAMAGPRPVVLLPGRMDTAIAGFLTIMLPVIDRLSESREPASDTTATLARKVASPIGLAEVVPVRLARGQVEPIASGYWPLGLLADTDGWLLVGADSEGFPAGSQVVIRPWP